MQEEIKINRMMPNNMSGGMPTGMSGQNSPKKAMMMKVVVLVVILAVVILGIVFRSKFNTLATERHAPMMGYQGVFLTNGQVYFGKMSEDDGYVTLTNVYYLQVPQGATQPQLIKLGSEIHGPTDQMHISRSQVLFYETLRADSTVVKAIEGAAATPAK